jgi:hypothetical protein
MQTVGNGGPVSQKHSPTTSRQTDPGPVTLSQSASAMHSAHGSEVNGPPQIVPLDLPVTQ